MPEKRALFAVDTYFRDSWEDACRSLGEARGDFVNTHAVVLVKPDAVAARRVLAVVEWLDRFGATIVAAERCMLTPHVIRALWQYQWNKATRDRRDLADLLMPSTESLMLVVRRQVASDVPYTLVISEAKGPADPAKREPHHLRYTLGNENYLLNFVHTTDEPADMVREIGILVDSPRRRSLYEAVASQVDAQDRACREAEQLHGQVPHQNLSLGFALEQLRERAAARPPGPARDALIRSIDAAARGASRDWRRICRQAEALGIPLDRWSTIVIGTHLMTAAEANRDPIIGSVVPEDWAAAAASYDADREARVTARGR